MRSFITPLLAVGQSHSPTENFLVGLTLLLIGLFFFRHAHRLWSRNAAASSRRDDVPYDAGAMLSASLLFIGTGGVVALKALLH